jgi:hypothetical protein
MNAITSSSLNNSKNTLRDHLISGGIIQELFEGFKYTNLGNSNSSLIESPNTQFDWARDRNAFQRLKHLAYLPEKWDGYDAPKFSRRQINRALEIFAFVQSYQKRHQIEWQQIEPFIAPGSDGSILFEWAGKRFPQKNLEIHVTKEPNLSIEYLKTDIEMDSDIEEKCQMNEISDLLNWLLTPII